MAIDGICNDHLQIGSIGGQAWTIHGHEWNAMESQYGQIFRNFETLRIGFWTLTDCKIFSTISDSLTQQLVFPNVQRWTPKFEHMLFKGTPRIGAMNWEKESVLLKQIEELYEKHRKTADPAEKKKIYAGKYLISI